MAGPSHQQMWPLPYHSRYDPYILWNVTCLSWIGCRCTWTRKKSSTKEFTEDVQCNARTPSLRLTVADARNSVVAEVEHAKLRQFPKPLDVGDLVPRQIQRVQALRQRSGGDMNCMTNRTTQIQQRKLYYLSTSY